MNKTYIRPSTPLEISLGKWISLLAIHSLIFTAASAAETPPATSSPAATSTELLSSEELDRPGEVENPFVLPIGATQVVSYVLAANSEAREAEGIGAGGSATLLQAGVRFGIAPHLEGQIFADTFLQEVDKGSDGDDPGQSRAGLGFMTLRAKIQLFGESSSEDGLAITPAIRFPTNHSLTGQNGVEPELIVPFDFDLEHGWEVQGSTGIIRGAGEEGRRTTDWETQASLEWHFAPRWSLYVEPELEAGDGHPQWAVEQGLTCLISRKVQLDIGVNCGLGTDSRAHFAYLGVGWSL